MRTPPRPPKVMKVEKLVRHIIAKRLHNYTVEDLIAKGEEMKSLYESTYENSPYASYMRKDEYVLMELSAYYAHLLN